MVDDTPEDWRKADVITERYLETNFPDSGGESLPQDVAEWLARQEFDAATALRLERMRRENPDVFLRACNSVLDDRIRPVLIGVIAENGAARYDALTAFTTVSRRTTRKRVRELETAELVSTSDTNPVVVSWASDRVAVLVKDVFSLYDSMNN